MTFGLLHEIIKQNNIPEDVKLMSDSGWECNATEMDGVYYNREENVIVFTQDAYPESIYARNPKKWGLLYGEIPDWYSYDEED